MSLVSVVITKMLPLLWNGTRNPSGTTKAFTPGPNTFSGTIATSLGHVKALEMSTELMWVKSPELTLFPMSVITETLPDPKTPN